DPGCVEMPRKRHVRRSGITPIGVFNCFYNRSHNNKLLDGSKALYAFIHVLICVTGFMHPPTA
ncbi:hypothetical protein, partial [Paraburkholderia atlantica]|uniref:hypothetical protein n=1 Tax=Paraburkholderia atlantica TaxID=2654982 RepID=UPI001C3782D0